MTARSVSFLILWHSTKVLHEQPIITVKEARKVMGKFANKYTDLELEKLIIELDHIAKLQLHMVPKVHE